MLLPTAVTPRVGMPKRSPASTRRVMLWIDWVSNSPPTNTWTAMAATPSRAASSTSTASCSLESSFRMLGPARRSLEVAVVDREHHGATRARVEDAREAALHAPVERRRALQEEGLA